MRQTADAMRFGDGMTQLRLANPAIEQKSVLGTVAIEASRPPGVSSRLERPIQLGFAPIDRIRRRARPIPARLAGHLPPLPPAQAAAVPPLTSDDIADPV
jgi:hypothetical protein